MTTEDGNRWAQIVAGTTVLWIAAVLLVGHHVLGGDPPRDLELYIGAGGVVVGLWLVVPVGMGRIGEQIRALYRAYREER